jgi:hypothetical protein
MNKMNSGRGVGVRPKKPSREADFEFEITALLSECSDICGKTMLLTEKLQSAGFVRSSAEAFEAGIMLKNALRIFADAMSHLPT